MAYPLHTLAAILGCHPSGTLPERGIRKLTYDSRKITDPEHTLFFALKAHRDGHAFMDEAWRSGVRAFVCEKGRSKPELKESVFLEVEDPLHALQEVAAYHRSLLDFPVAGITGSNGKTVVKEWLAYLLAGELKLGRSPKSYNSQIGLPVSVWQLDRHLDLGLIEAGISTKGEMDHLSTVLKPDWGIFTSIGSAHDSGFSSMQEKIREKLKLFETADFLVYPDHYPTLSEEIEHWARGRDIVLHSWGVRENSSYRITSQVQEDKTRIRFGEHAFFIPFTDSASVENACTCLATLLALRQNPEHFVSRFASLPTIEMRLQLVQGQYGCQLINDTYSNDFSSLEIALQFLTKQSKPEQRLVVISSMAHADVGAPETYLRLRQLFSEYEVRSVMAIGEDYYTDRPLLAEEISYFPDTADFIRSVERSLFRDMTVLVKGRRDFGLERVIRKLEARVHETVLEINLNALEHNFRLYRSRVAPGTRVMAMVKAQGYGSGSLEIARQLQQSGADYLAVAYTDEGIVLRREGISLPIMVMNAARGSLKECLDHGLEPVVYDFEMLDFLESTLSSSGITEAGIHVEFDTGMHRLGFLEEQLGELLQRLKAQPGIKVRSVFSHLAAADEPKHDAYTRGQLERFTAIREHWLSQSDGKPLFHILNTSGIERFPEFALDMIRPGIGLYGIQSGAQRPEGLEPVAILKARISQITKLEKGESVGYSRAGRMETDGTIAVVSIGYADGFRRILSNGKGKVWINGALAPVIGNICMDMCMVDVSGIECREGDEVEIFGQNQLIENLALDAETIPYEIITGISSRVSRVYFRE